MSTTSRTPLLDQVKLHYSPLTTEKKLTAVEYDNVFVSAQQLCGVRMKIEFYCSKAVFNRLSSYLGSDDYFPDLEKAAKFEGLLYIKRFHPEQEWAMEEDQDLWDQEVNDLIDLCRGPRSKNCK